MASLPQKLVLVLWLVILLVSAAHASDNSDQDSARSDEIDFSQNFTLDEGQELPRSSKSQQYHSEIEEVLSSDDFAQKEKVKRWRFKRSDDQPEDKDEKYPQWLIDFVEWIEGDGSTLMNISKGLEIFLWGVLFVFIFFFVIRYRQQLNNFIQGGRNESVDNELPSSMFGLDLKRDSMPLDTVQVARSSWAAGEHREAVATLLRSSLIKLLHVHDCRFYDSDTEAECCDRIDQQAPQSICLYMRKLVSAWQSIAYAHQSPSNAIFDQLCDQWDEIF